MDDDSGTNMKSPTLKDAVESVLRKYPSARDNDVYLFVWVLNEVWGIDLHSVNSIDLLKMMNEGKCPRFDSISRLRRELQEQDVSLRGAEYWKRQAEADHIRAEKRKVGTQELLGLHP